MAGTSAGLFTVNISLSNPNGITAAAPAAVPGSPSAAPAVCISQTLSEQTNAMVQVICGTGQFVSIMPSPGKPFLGTHGGAFRYNFDGGKVSGVQLLDAVSAFTGAGTVTALRIYNANGSDTALEMLVSF
jgi:hypothetical protein